MKVTELQLSLTRIFFVENMNKDKWRVEINEDEVLLSNCQTEETRTFTHYEALLWVLDAMLLQGENR